MNVWILKICYLALIFWDFPNFTSEIWEKTDFRYNSVERNFKLVCQCNNRGCDADAQYRLYRLCYSHKYKELNAEIFLLKPFLFFFPE